MGIVPAYKNRKLRFATRSGGRVGWFGARDAPRWRLRTREENVPRRTRTNLALSMMAIAIVLNLILLFSGDTSPGWPLAAVILLGAAGALVLSQRREY